MDNEKIKIMIADDNLELSRILREMIDNSECYEVVGNAVDGEQALQLIPVLEPDVLLLDIIMPFIDGIEVMERIHAMNLSKFPKIVVLSGCGNERMSKRAFELGADYFLVKPFDLMELMNRIKQLFPNEEMINMHLKAQLTINSSKNDHDDLQLGITEIMHQIGIPAHIRGHDYIREAIIMVTNDMGLINSFAKQIYPLIAEKYNTNASNVERAIRHGVDLSFSRGNEMIHNIFGNSLENRRKKPGNSEFIATIAVKMRLISKSHNL